MATYVERTNQLINRRIIKLTILLLLAGALTGCVHSLLEADYGAAVTYNETVQIARPEAGLNNSPAVGMSPVAGTRQMEAYNKSFERKVEQKAPYASFINMGTSSQ